VHMKSKNGNGPQDATYKLEIDEEGEHCSMIRRNYMQTEIAFCVSWLCGV
jgi:hypothetical protein